MQIRCTDQVLIVGAGLGALYAALELAPRPVLMLSPDPLGEGASSAWAQGGVAAAMAQNDSAEAHAVDTVHAGAGIVDDTVATEVTGEARRHILDLTDMGTPFDRTTDGGYVLSREAAHSVARVVRVQGDQAGAEIMAALVNRVRATPSIQVIEGALVTGLVVMDGRVTGVDVARLDQDKLAAPVRVSGAACLLAGGGSGGLYALTTNPKRICGQAIGMAARAGARIADPEFVQFHPTAIDTGEAPAPLATEALRGAGALLINRLGQRFMEAVHPNAELAPRDIVARAVYAEARAGRRPMLDARGVKDLTLTYPALTQACRRAGIDPSVAPVPIAAAAHFHIGGVDTDRSGRTSLPGLWVCGEAASTGLHGANRLASNGLLEALVFGRRAARDIAENLPDTPSAPQFPLALSDTGQAVPPKPALVAQLRRTMTAGAGVVRTAEGLSQTLRDIAAIEAAQPDCAPLLNMTATATLIAAAGLMRQESRGAHFRADHPKPAGDTGTRSRLTLQEALAIRATATKETA